MHSLQKQFHDFIHANHLVKKDEKVLLAVSGGLDSMVMASLFLSAEIPFAIAHCNYGLRGEESDSDEAFVMGWADSNNINCFVKAIDVSHGSTQLAARKARYSWFEELANEQGFGKIATAHHLNDSLETVLINLSRGTGIKGVTGISIRNGNIIRPLLFTEKQDLYLYAMEIGLEWREDSSNERTDYDRNLIRHEIVPQLLKLNPSLLRTFGRTAERLTHAADILSQRVASIQSQYLKEEKEGWQLDLSWIHAASDELVLAEVLAEYGVNYATAKEIFEARGKSGKSFPLEKFKISMDRASLFISKLEEHRVASVKIDKEGTFQMGDSKLKVEKVDRDQVVFTSGNDAYFDATKLTYPLIVRRWKHGDKIQPLGMSGQKTISDLLIDIKVPTHQKKDVLILESNGEIAWVIGYRISDHFKISESTQRIIRVQFIQQ